MPATGQVRQLSPADAERVVGLLEGLLAHRAAEDELIRRIQRILDPIYRGMERSRRRGRTIRISGRHVRLPPKPARVLEILASGDGPGPRSWSTGEIRQHIEAARRLSGSRKKDVTRRSVVQAVYRIRLAFRAAGLPDDLIRGDGASWELAIPAEDLAALRRASDKG